MPLKIQAETSLPTLGYSGAYSVSIHQEHWLGQAWLRQFRAQVPIRHDPVTQYYLEQQVAHLAGFNSALEVQQLVVLLVDQPRLNAFAVPGGIVGLNTGLWAFALYEDELVSVLAHELAHLSQRHFARRVEAARHQQWSTMAGILAGVLVASQGHADVGIAAIATTQAANIQSQLAWSRSFEQEADRIGMETLIAAGYSAHAMPRMLAHMERLAQLSGRAPEFLMTHPLTDSRIADAFARADHLGHEDQLTHSIGYELLRIRQVFAHQSIAEAQAFLQRDPLSEAGQLYRRILALAMEDPEVTTVLWERLLAIDPEDLVVQYLWIEGLIQRGQIEQATQALVRWQRIMPDYPPFLWLTAQSAQQQQQWSQAQQILQQLSRIRSHDPFVWAALAEAAGRSGQRILAHQAQAEYLQLTGRLSQAMQQFDWALSLAQQQKMPWASIATLSARQAEVQALREKLEALGGF